MILREDFSATSVQQLGNQFQSSAVITNIDILRLRYLSDEHSKGSRLLNTYDVLVQND